MIIFLIVEYIIFPHFSLSYYSPIDYIITFLLFPFIKKTPYDIFYHKDVLFQYIFKLHKIFYSPLIPSGQLDDVDKSSKTPVRILGLTICVVKKVKACRRKNISAVIVISSPTSQGIR